jgi:hypothetical protein
VKDDPETANYSEEFIEQVYRCFAAGWSTTVISDTFGITTGIVYKLRVGRTVRFHALYLQYRNCIPKRSSIRTTDGVDRFGPMEVYEFVKKTGYGMPMPFPDTARYREENRLREERNAKLPVVRARTLQSHQTLRPYLSDVDLRDMFERYAKGESRASIAERYGLSKERTAAILNLTYAWVRRFYNEQVNPPGA